MSMMIAAMEIGDRAWVLPAVIVGAVLALLVVGAYVLAAWPTRLRFVGAALKLAGLALLLICLVEPLWSGTRVKPGENLFLVLVDNSASLRVRDADSDSSRAEILSKELGDSERPWQIRLAQDFELRRYVFDSRVAAVDDYSSMMHDGTASSLGSALGTLGDRFRERPVAGVLLFTDGNATDWSSQVIEDWGGLAPVFPVLVPAGAEVADVSVNSVNVTQTSFEDAPVTIQADVAAVGVSPEEIVGQLVTDDGVVVDEVRAGFTEDGLPTALRFQVRPDAAGLSYYRVRVADAGAGDPFAESGETNEATLENNERPVVVDRGGGPFRVLYVSGRPNWEFKFLRRAVEDDDQIDLLAMIRIARREAKFDFRGNEARDASNLFDGFKERDEETESYDQPVIVRMGNLRDEAELRDGFPRTKEDLYEYHALILDDVEAGFFTRDQLTLIERFVSERGGGLLMLGGPDTFRHGNYDHTPIADLLPVYVDRTITATPSREYRLNLTRDGWLQPWVRLRNNELDERQRLEDMTGFEVLTRVRNVKPAAEVLATVSTSGGETLPALVAQKYGDGRAAALLIGDMWRWSLRREADAEDDLAKSWRQTVRWLVADVPERVDAEAEATTTGGVSAMRVAIDVRDPAYQPLDNATVKVTVHRPGEDPIALDAEPSLEKSGRFETTFVPRSPGGYRAEVVAYDENGEETGRTEVGWASSPAADEFRAVSINTALLDDVAAQTGGETVPWNGLAAFVESLPTRAAPQTETWTSPLWHAPWFLLSAIVLLAGEWGLRRLRGLP